MQVTCKLNSIKKVEFQDKKLYWLESPNKENKRYEKIGYRISSNKRPPSNKHPPKSQNNLISPPP